jgi:hypothetical protein
MAAQASFGQARYCCHASACVLIVGEVNLAALAGRGDSVRETGRPPARRKRPGVSLNQGGVRVGRHVPVHKQVGEHGAG